MRRRRREEYGTGRLKRKRSARCVEGEHKASEGKSKGESERSIKTGSAADRRKARGATVDERGG